MAADQIHNNRPSEAASPQSARKAIACTSAAPSCVDIALRTVRTAPFSPWGVQQGRCCWKTGRTKNVFWSVTKLDWFFSLLCVMLYIAPHTAITSFGFSVWAFIAKSNLSIPPFSRIRFLLDSEIWRKVIIINSFKITIRRKVCQCLAPLFLHFHVSQSLTSE